MKRTIVVAVLALALSACGQKAPHYADCDAARKAGAAPLHKGEPGYRAELDRNSDGVACE